MIDRLEETRLPTIAVIHGFCLGGGLEIALACKFVSRSRTLASVFRR